MRNPYFVEVKLENKGIFSAKNDKDSVHIKEFANIDDKLELNK